MKIAIEDIQIKRHINPRFELDGDYIEELRATDHCPAVTVTREMTLVDGFHRLSDLL
jgi:hypothetical protein